MVRALLKAAIEGFSGSGRDRRALPRLDQAGATVMLGRVSHPLTDWNTEGFSVSHYNGRLQAGEKTRVRILLPHREISYGFDMNCEVRHADPMRKSLGCVFTDVDPATSQRLKRIFADRVR
ncbi:MAG: hypothetical protein RLN70_06170 [Rhodospirillaceae bacterium]